MISDADVTHFLNTSVALSPSTVSTQPVSGFLGDDSFEALRETVIEESGGTVCLMRTLWQPL